MKKGQSALEFLSTYGMSFIILLFVIGGLSYFDILNVSSFVPESCSLDKGFFCPLYSVNTTNNATSVDISILNSGNDRVEITNMSIKDGSLEDYCFAQNITQVADNSLVQTPIERTLSIGEEVEMHFEFATGSSNCNISNSFYEGDRKRKLDVRLYYVISGATQQSSVTGKIITRANLYS